jgi:uncharacterized membrane protein YidH (DUF202 family)
MNIEGPLETLPSTRGEHFRRLLAGVAGFITAILSIALPVSLLWRRADEAESGSHLFPPHAASVWVVIGVLAMADIPALLLAFLAYKLLRFSLKNRGDSFRWVNAPLALLVGPISGFTLYTILQGAYWDYYLYPKLKAAEGYIYPQLRYTIFDVVVILWCLVGLAACGLLFQNVFKRRTIGGWSYRTTLAFIIIFGILIIGAAFGSCIRSMGF